MSRSHTLCILALAAGFLAFASSAKAATPKQILSDLAANQTHSWIDNSLGFDKLTARYKAGERINVTCGFVSEVARRLLVEAGYTARVVQTITLEEFDSLNDGHAMVEVWADRRWRLYDVDANIRAVDAQGQGISLVEQMVAVKEGRALWEPIADDAPFREDEPNLVLRELAREVFADVDGFYRRVMGIAFLPADAAGTGNDGLYYIDDSQTERLRAAGLLSGRYLTTPTIWWNLTGVGPVPRSSASVAPAAEPVTAVAPAPIAPAVKPSCAKLKRQYRKTHTKKALRKYRRCVRTSRSA
jgi:hypothetical protein